MTYDEFWFGEPRRVIAYRKASYLKMERENYNLWLQGAYVYDAFGKVIASAFGKGSPRSKRYMDSPIDILPKSNDERLIEAQKKRDALVKQLNAWANSFRG